MDYVQFCILYAEFAAEICKKNMQNFNPYANTCKKICRNMYKICNRYVIDMNYVINCIYMRSV